jgi:hypothetical protein
MLYLGRTVATGVLLLAFVCATASPASAWYQRYVTNAVFPPGASAGSQFNSLRFNAAQWGGQYGTSPYMGTRYVRSDGTATGWLWSNSGNLYDSRTIAYGSAWCAASLANSYALFVTFCDTGSG